MGNKLFVGGLSWNITNDELRKIFSAVGTVLSAEVVFERETGRSKGFAFVEMGTPEEAQRAIEQLDGKEFDGRRIGVSIARPKEERPPRRGFQNDRNRSFGL